MTQQWVVTYKIDTRQGMTVVEFYRGTHDECVRIALNSWGRGESDQQRTGSWKPVLAAADDWDAFVMRGCDPTAFQAVPVEAR